MTISSQEIKLIKIPKEIFISWVHYESPTWHMLNHTPSWATMFASLQRTLSTLLITPYICIDYFPSWQMLTSSMLLIPFVSEKLISGELTLGAKHWRKNFSVLLKTDTAPWSFLTVNHAGNLPVLPAEYHGVIGQHSPRQPQDKQTNKQKSHNFQLTMKRLTSNS